MLDDQLLQEQESSLVIYSLSDLSLGYPSMRSICLFTIIALEIIYYKLYYETLLQ